MPQSVTNLSESVVRGNWSGRTQIYGIHNRGGETSANSFLQGIALSSNTSYDGEATAGRHLQVSITQSLGEGFPSAPCISLERAGFWRFRWAVKAGPRAAYVWAQQNSTGSVYRPSMVVKNNPNVGLDSDLSASAGEGPGWQQVGPITFTATGNGVVWVELHNNYTGAVPPAISASYFDHIITT